MPPATTSTSTRVALGVHHIVRPGDWRVAPVPYAGFSLKPAVFFEGNPALDVPAPTHHGNGHCHA